jgi:hypothetical protein
MKKKKARQFKLASLRTTISIKTGLVAGYSALQLAIVGAVVGYCLDETESVGLPLRVLFEWCMSMFNESHRGVRAAVSAGITQIIARHAANTVAVRADAASSSHPVSVMQESLQQQAEFLYLLLSDPLRAKSLFKKRADLIGVLWLVLPYSEDKKVRTKALAFIIRRWDDADRDVRITAIRGVRHLHDCGFPELVALRQTEGEHKSSALVHEIIGRMKQPGYTQKPELQELLEHVH